jgi:hypothetical protein
MNNNKATRHYDGWGNPILSFFDMRAYWAKCDRSTAVLKAKLPYAYACIPHVTIRIDKVCRSEATVFCLYPGGSECKVYFLNERRLEALRRLYKAPRGGWVVKETPQDITFKKLGCVVALRWNRFGVW